MQVVVPCASRLPARVADVAFGGRGRAAAMDQPAGRADRPGILGDRAHEIHLHLERGVAFALGQRGVDAAAEAGVEQRHREPAMHRAERIVVAELPAGPRTPPCRARPRAGRSRAFRRSAAPDSVAVDQLLEEGRGRHGSAPRRAARHRNSVPSRSRRAPSSWFREKSTIVRFLQEACRTPSAMPSITLRCLAISLPAKSMKARTRAVWRRSAWVSSQIPLASSGERRGEPGQARRRGADEAGQHRKPDAGGGGFGEAEHGVDAIDDAFRRGVVLQPFRRLQVGEVVAEADPFGAARIALQIERFGRLVGRARTPPRRCSRRAARSAPRADDRWRAPRRRRRASTG